jgi:hypothetical protein
MNPPKSKQKPRRLVWRMSRDEPAGRFVDPDASAVGPSPSDLPEVYTGGWLASTFDLLNGADVRDFPDTVPSELWDELIANPSAPPKARDR